MAPKKKEKPTTTEVKTKVETKNLNAAFSCHKHPPGKLQRTLPVRH